MFNIYEPVNFHLLPAVTRGRYEFNTVMQVSNDENFMKSTGTKQEMSTILRSKIFFVSI